MFAMKIGLLSFIFYQSLIMVNGEPEPRGGRAAAVGAGVAVGAAAGVIGAVAVHDMMTPHYYTPAHYYAPPAVVVAAPPTVVMVPPPAPVIVPPPAAVIVSPPAPVMVPPPAPIPAPIPAPLPPVPTTTMAPTPPPAPPIAPPASVVPPCPATPVATGPPSSTTAQLSLTIYYDAMETNSQIFFNTTLVNAFGCFSSYLDVNFVPCQQATDNNGALTCLAKSDPSCSLDIIHSCAISQTADKTQLVNFLACTMNNVENVSDFSACAAQNKIDAQKIQSCASTDMGKSMCRDYSKEKMPNCSVMPGFVFRKSSDKQSPLTFEHLDNYISDVSATDLKSAVCAQLKAIQATSTPQECNQKLVLGIFYKAMDANSQKWFQSFAAVYGKFSNSLTVKYEPCMFAELSGTGDLDCKDPADTGCMAAKTHACAVLTITDPTLLFQFLSCAMKDSTTVPNFEKCAADNKIPYDGIKACAESDMGKQLCFHYSKTRPKSDKIPSFSYELTFDDAISEETSAAANLKTTFCQQMTKYGITQPPECTAP